VAEAATLARPYAKAAFETARDAKLLAAWSESLQVAAALVGDARIVDLLDNPKLSEDEVVGFFDGFKTGADGMHWLNFIRLLAENKRLSLLPEIAARFELLRADYENEVDVLVTSAVPLSDAQKAKLADSLKTRLRRDVRITTALDPGLLGGALIRAGDLVIDGSIKGRLQRLTSDLGG
jgi:F-type H+-transporting ATPase subunit delta